MGYKMNPGSKEKNTPGNFSQKANDSIKKTTIGKRATGIKNMPPNNTPNATDSLAVYMRNSDKRSSYTDIANAAEKKYGKIDVSNYDIMKKGQTNVSEARKKYGLNK